jgi:aspartyl protease family protein
MISLGDDQQMRLIYLVALLAFLLAGFAWRGGAWGANLRHFAIWAAIALALVGAYAYREPLLWFAGPVVQELMPSRVVEVTNPDGASELVVSRGSDGHFHLDAEANGTPIRFLVDTGASDTVLTVTDAERSGIDTSTLRFNRPVQTANGVAFDARARLESLAIGPYRLNDVPIGVMPDEALGGSLLGMSTINRFAGWRVEGNRMILTP